MFKEAIKRCFGRGPKPPQIKDSAAEVSLFRRRCLAAAALVVVLGGALVGRMIYLQIFQFQLYNTQAENNRIRVEPLAPARGLIYDRLGNLLAENRPTYNLTITREQSGNPTEIIDRIISLLQLPPDMRQTLIERSEQRQRPYEAALLLSDLTEWQIARLALNRFQLPGVEVEPQLIRYYPDSIAMSHVVGYVGRISAGNLKGLDTTNYAGTHFIGKMGIESQYENILHGKVGMRRVETNVHGRILGVVDRTAPVKGQDVTLTLSSKLQDLGMHLLKGKRGAIVAIQPQTGAILAMVSAPGFDTNEFVRGISTQDYEALQNDKNLPLYSRATRGEYPPASTIKPYMALAGLNDDVITPQYTIFDPGYYRLPGNPHKFRNVDPYGSGRVDLHKAIAISNDTYFFNLAHMMGIDRIDNFVDKFGFGSRTALDVWGARPGLLPSREWKEKRFRQSWYWGDTVSIGIGQGYFLATPLQLATALSVIANRGKWVTPHLLAAVGSDLTKPPYANTPPDVVLKNPDYWNVVISGMEAVANNNPMLRAGRNYTMAAKTGTAQVFTVGQNQHYTAADVAERLRDHSLFVAFAPVKNPQIAIAVVVENGGYGIKTAAPIARKIMDSWLNPGTNHELHVPNQQERDQSFNSEATQAPSDNLGAW